MNSKILSRSDLLRMDEHLSAIDWPDLKKIEVPSIERGDFLLVCAGFEDRSMESLRRICDAGKKDFSLIVVDYLPKYEENKREELYEIARNSNLESYELIYDRENPTGIGEKLGEYLKKQATGRVFLDISGMSRLLIVQILVELVSEQNRPIIIIYGEAEKYFPSEKEFNEGYKKDGDKSVPSYLSSGIFEIAITPELSAVAMLGEAIRLISFPSFDHTQLTNSIQELQPTYVEVINGIPLDTTNKWRTDAIHKLNQPTLDMLKNFEKHEVCTFDYKKALNTLLKIYAEHNIFNRLVIAPTGSKMQTVAVALFRAALHDIQIVYPTPREFTPKKYTSGLRQLYEVEIPVKQIFSNQVT